MSERDEAREREIDGALDDHFYHGIEVVISPGDLHYLRDQLREARAALATVTRERDEARQAQQWQPMETAPKDGTDVLVWSPEWACIEVAEWSESEQRWLGFDGSLDPIVWMPLPEAPR